MDLDLVKKEVQKLLAQDNTGYGFEHVSRVYDMAVALSKKEKADVETVFLAALLHDVDDV